MKKSLNDSTGVGFALFYCGLIYIYRGLFTEASFAMDGAFEAWSTVPKNERLMCYYHFGAGLLAQAQGEHRVAQEALEKALELSGKLELRAENIENLSALSQAKLGMGDPEAALAASNQAINLLATQKDVEEVQMVYLNHYRVLKANNDAQADKYLQTAYDTMLERASRLEDETQRRTYLEQVKVNQDIMTARRLPAGSG
jgi:tetratricopeptide (TPR) repeat protein